MPVDGVTATVTPKAPITHSEGDGAFVFRLPGLRQQVGGPISGAQRNADSNYNRGCLPANFPLHPSISQSVLLRAAVFASHPTAPPSPFPPRHLAVVGLGQAPRMRAMMLSGVVGVPAAPDARQLRRLRGNPARLVSVGSLPQDSDSRRRQASLSRQTTYANKMKT